MIDLVGFRARFPEFTQATCPDDTVNFWIGEADAMFDPCRWDDLLDRGSAYWVAHSITVAKDDATKPFIDDATMKKVGDISKSRDPKLMLEQAKNPYMRTKYGQRYWQLAQMVGAGSYSV